MKIIKGGPLFSIAEKIAYINRGSVVTKKNGKMTGYFLLKYSNHREKFQQPKNCIVQYLRDEYQSPNGYNIYDLASRLISVERIAYSVKLTGSRTKLTYPDNTHITYHYDRRLKTQKGLVVGIEEWVVQLSLDNLCKEVKP